LARYNVIGWRSVLEGKTNPYRNSFDAAFTRFRQFGFPHVVSPNVTKIRRHVGGFGG
jgi:hypothetical protein